MSKEEMLAELNQMNMTKLPANILNIDYVFEGGYERSPNQAKIRKIMADFEPKLAQPVKVSQRNSGDYYVYDGQHTLLSQQRLFGDGVSVSCIVWRGLTREDEAILYEKQTGFSSKPNSIELFQSQFQRGEETAKAIADIVTANGFRFPFIIDKDGRRATTNWNAIGCIQALRNSYSEYDGKTLDSALKIIYQSWNGDRNCTCGEIVQGMSLFVKALEGQYKPADLINKLSKIPCARIISNSKEQIATSMPKKVATVLLNIYNTGKRNRLELRI